MQRNGTPITILVADDDADDRMLIDNAFGESKLQNPLHFVEDGEQKENLRIEIAEIDVRRPVRVVCGDVGVRHIGHPRPVG